MTKRPVKLLHVWIAVSSVIILAGIMLFALLGFNHAAERPEKKTFEVEYDVVVENATDGIETLKTASEAALEKFGVSYIGFTKAESIDSSNGSATSGGKLIYTLSASVSDSTLEKAKGAVVSAAESFPETAEIYVSYHASYNKTFTEAAWRGAIAVAVGAIVSLVYVGVRFGVGSALTGLTLCVHDVFVALGILAITRIPVYYFAPIVIGALAAAVSLVLWLVQCMKMRENFKDLSYAALSAEEAVEQSSKTAKKTILVVAGALGIAFAVFGIVLAIGGSQLGAILLPLSCILPVAAGAYSSLLFGPALHVHVKAAFDQLKTKQKRYSGKAKAEKQKEN